MRACYDWQPGNTIYYVFKDEPGKYYRGKVIKRDFIDMYGVKTYMVNDEKTGSVKFIPYEDVCDEDMVEYLNDICGYHPNIKNITIMDSNDVEKEILHNKESYYTKYIGHINISLSYLSNVFGDSFVWKILGHELVGCSEELNQLVVVDDGVCCKEAHENTGWHVVVYDFEDCEHTAQEWFDANYKCCSQDGVDTLEFIMNGIDFPEGFAKK